MSIVTYADPSVTYSQGDRLYDGGELWTGWWVDVWDVANSTPLIRPLPDVVDVSFEVVPNDVGRGSITLAADHRDLADICDPRGGVQTLVKVWLHGRYQWGFLAETVDDVYADDGARQVRVSGPGVESALGWGRVLWRDYPVQPSLDGPWLYGSGQELLPWGSLGAAWSPGLPFEGHNLIANPGFESGVPDPWVAGLGATIGVNTLFKHGGAYSLEANVNVSGGGVRVQFPLDVGWLTTVTMWVQNNVGTTVTLSVFEPGGDLLASVADTVGSQWVQFSVTFTTTKPDILLLVTMGSAGRLLIDDVEVTARPATLSLVSATAFVERLVGGNGLEVSFDAGGDTSEVSVGWEADVQPGTRYLARVNVSGDPGDVVRFGAVFDGTPVETTAVLDGSSMGLLVSGVVGPLQTTLDAYLASGQASAFTVHADDFSLRPGFPAATAGGIVSDVVSAMQARGTLTFLTLGFDATADSAGDPWSETLGMELDPAWSLLDLLAKLVGFGYEWMIDLTSGVRLDLYGPLGAGVDWTGATGAPTILPGPAVESADAQALVPATTVVFVEGADGVWTSQESGVSGLGRRELLVVNTAAQTSQETGLVAARALSQAEAAGEAFTVRLTDAGDPMPFLDFFPMDTVRVHLPRGGPGVDYRAAMLATNPVAYWRLGETSGTTAADSSGNGHDGTYVNGPTLGQPGLLTGDPDTAVLFDGVDDRVTVTQDPALKLPGAMSVEAWIRPTVVATTDIVRQGLGTDLQYSIATGPAGRIGCYWHDGAFRGVEAPAGTIVAGNTYHVVFTRDASLFIRGYVNGMQVVSGQGTAPTGDPAGFLIGGNDGFRLFNGTIDEVAVYNVALTPTQVAALYVRGVQGPIAAEPDEIPDGWYRARAVAFAGTRESMRFDVDFGRYRTLRRDAESLLLSRLLDRQASDTWTPGEGSVAS